ncbi:MAG: hypothetical protein RIS02_589, partial [Pseudomonadota bacterium]
MWRHGFKVWVSVWPEYLEFEHALEKN